MGRFDGDVDELDPQALGQCGGVGHRPGARVARRHRQTVHMTGTKGIHGDGGDERRVDSPRRAR